MKDNMVTLQPWETVFTRTPWARLSWALGSQRLGISVSQLTTQHLYRRET